MLLPGQVRIMTGDELSVGHLCETCNRPASHYIVCEADSFGEELAYVCGDHLDDFVNSIKESSSRSCPMCGKEGEIRPYRDPEEGMYGPVHYACGDCITDIKNRFCDDSGYDDDDDWYSGYDDDDD